MSRDDCQPYYQHPVVAEHKFVVRGFDAADRKPPHQNIVDGRRYRHAPPAVRIEHSESAAVRRFQSDFPEHREFVQIIDIEIAGKNHAPASGHRLGKFSDLPHAFFTRQIKMRLDDRQRLSAGNRLGDRVIGRLFTF